MRAPRRGDLVRVDFDPRLGHEQSGHRPALVLSNSRYNKASGMIVACPITSKVKGYPLEVALPAGLETVGVVLAHQVRALDWRARNARVIEPAPADLVEEVLDILVTLLEGDA